MRQGWGNMIHDDELHVQFVMQNVLCLWLKNLGAV